MNVEKQTLASEIIAEHEEHLNRIIFELDSTIDELLEKGKFALTELMDLIDERPENVNDACSFASNQEKMNMFAHVAFDYLDRVQSGIGEIVIKERRRMDE